MAGRYSNPVQLVNGLNLNNCGQTCRARVSEGFLEWGAYHFAASIVLRQGAFS